VPETQLARAEVLRERAPYDAVTAARAAHTAAVRLGAEQLRDRTAAMLRALGASVPRRVPAHTALKELSGREAEILDGLRRGETNAAIAARLFPSTKTVERHVSNVFVELGVRNRAEAAAPASAIQTPTPPDEPT
jgi:DNA-binding NarL/FixJ family response regulator